MQKNKKILFISYDGMTDPLGQSQVIPYLQGLTKYNYEFTILSCDKHDLYKKNKEYVDKMIEFYPIKWVSIRYHKYPPVLSSFYDLMRVKRTAAKLHKKEHFVMVHTRPGVPTLAALWLKRKYGVKFLNDIRGFWADERVDGGMWNLKNPVFKNIYSFFKEHEYDCLREADYNTCLTYRAKNEIESWGIKQPLDMEVIPCSVDLNLFNPSNINADVKERFRAELKIEEKDLVVSYLGSVGGWYLLDEMMRFFGMLLERIPSVKLLFISPHRHEQISAAAKKYGIPSERIIAKRAWRHEVPVLLSFSDYSLFFIKPSYSKMSSSPTKHAEIMAMAIPLITNSGVGDIDQIIKTYNAGIVLNSFENEEFLKAINRIIDKEVFSKQQIRQGAENYYALDNAVEKYRLVYEKILGRD